MRVCVLRPAAGDARAGRAALSPATRQAVWRGGGGLRLITLHGGPASPGSPCDVGGVKTALRGAPPMRQAPTERLPLRGAAAARRRLRGTRQARCACAAPGSAAARAHAVEAALQIYAARQQRARPPAHLDGSPASSDGASTSIG